MVNKEMISFGCLTIGFILIIVSFSVRVYHAYVTGNIWLAFITDTYMGFPWTHILVVLSLPFFFVGAILFPKEQQKIGEKNGKE